MNKFFNILYLQRCC